MHRAIVILLLLPAAWAQSNADLEAQFGPAVPDAPHKVFNAHFWEAETIHAAAISFDSYETISHEGRCALEGSNGFAENVQGKELALDGAIEFGASFGLTALLKWVGPPKHFKWTPYLIPAYGTALHVRGGIQWYRRCN